MSPLQRNSPTCAAKLERGATLVRYHCDGLFHVAVRAPGEAGAVLPVEVRPRKRVAPHLEASVAYPAVTTGAKRTQRS